MVPYRDCQGVAGSDNVRWRKGRTASVRRLIKRLESHGHGTAGNWDTNRPIYRGKDGRQPGSSVLMARYSGHFVKIQLYRGGGCSFPTMYMHSGIHADMQPRSQI